MAGRQVLGHASAHGRTVDVGPFDAEFVEHRDHVLREDRGAVRPVGLVAFTRTAVVECDGAANGVEVVADPVPPVVVVRLPRQQNEWCPLALALVGNTDSVGRCRVPHTSFFVSDGTSQQGRDK